MRCHRDDRVLTVGKLELGNRARAIAVVPAGSGAPALAARAVAQGADLVEVRIDRDATATPTSVVEGVRAIRGEVEVPLLGTIRLPGQRGDFEGSEADRLALYEALVPEVDLVDVEINSLGIRERVRAACTESDTVLVVSFHDTVQTPSIAAMEDLAREAVEEVGAQVFKMCAQATNLVDMARLLSFTQAFRDRYETAQIVGMSLGAIGAPSRLMGPAFGSCMTYGYVEGASPAVQGQLSIPELKRSWALEDEKSERVARSAERLADLVGEKAARESYQLRR